MKTLTSSSCTNIILDKKGDRPFFSSRELKQEVSDLPLKKLVHSVGFLNWLCVKHKPICPVRVSSSFPPESQVDLEGEDAQNQETNESKTVHVKFQLLKECSFGEQFTIVGDDPSLGLWDPESGIPLNWSDGHLWTVELDIPVGQSIQFKFILKGIAEKVFWQPGPDRILQTWETSNTIVVWEDWEDAALQKITEEEPSANGSEEPAVNPELLIVAENLIYQKEELVSDMNNGAVTVDVSSNPEKKPIVADNISPVQEKPLDIVADNINDAEGTSAVNVSNAVLGEKRTSHQEEEHKTISRKSTVNREDVVRNDDAPTAIDSANSDVQGSPVTLGGDAGLIPGLSAASAIPSEAATENEGERSHAFDASVGVDEKNNNLPELDEKREAGDEPLREETMNGLNDEEQHDNVLIHKPLLKEEKCDRDDRTHRQESTNGLYDEEQHGHDLSYKPRDGIQAFLHPSISLSQTSLIEVFVFKRCRNIACQNQLPADDCTCEICANRSGFCNLCMCVICNKFDFEVNTCRWIGCDLCSHWTHTDCAIRDGQICMGPSVKSGAGPTEMLFRCRACNRTSELLGWVKDVFQHCAPAWEREALTRELDFVSRIFGGSEDTRGRKLFCKCQELIEKMKGGLVESTACRVILMFFQELEVDSPKSLENGEGGRLIAPQEACNRIAEVVQEAMRKMEMVADEKMRMFKKARMALEACDRELEEKAKEVADLELDRQNKKLQIEELERIVRLKQAEADMFQLKANEAKREAERLQRIGLAKTDKSEEEYASSYLKLRLSEAEAEKQYLFEKIKLQESSRASQSSGGADPSQVLAYSKIHEILHGYNVPPKTEAQPNERHHFRTNP